MKKKERDYVEDIEVNEANLKQEWERQPGLYLHYSIVLADAERARNVSKEELDITKAQLDKDIRSRPEEFDVEKITESVVTNTILLQESYVEKNQEYIDRGYEVSIMQGVIRAFDHKKKALENLVTLYISGYNAEPKPNRREK
jgi:hypothetical protein